MNHFNVAMLFGGAIIALSGATAAPMNPLQSAFSAAHRDYAAQLLDKFSDLTADRHVIGQSFKFIGPLHDGTKTGNPPGPYYTYEDGKLRLIFNTEEQYAGRALDRSLKYRVGTIGGSRTPTNSYIGSNAFGARARVQVSRIEENGLALITAPEAEDSPYLPKPIVRGPALPKLPKDTYWLEIPASGPNARLLAADSRLVIEGTITTLDGDRISICKGTVGSGATVHNPIEVYGSECWIGAKVTRIAFIRQSTGEILKEWPATH